MNTQLREDAPASTMTLEAEPFCNRLRTQVDDMLDQAMTLRHALIQRRSTEIWAILAEQENLAVRFENDFKLWNELYAGREDLGDAANHAKAGLQEALLKLRRIEQSNGALSRSFLGVIRTALTQSTGLRLSSKKSSYNRRGRAYRTGQAMLVNRMG